MSILRLMKKLEQGVLGHPQQQQQLHAGILQHLQSLAQANPLQAHTASYLNSPRLRPGAAQPLGNQNTDGFQPQMQGYNNPQMGFGMQVQGVGDYQQPLQAGYGSGGIQARQSYLNLQ